MSYPKFLIVAGLRTVVYAVLPLFLLLTVPCRAYASLPAAIQRIDLKKKPSFTRITVKLTNEPKISMLHAPGGRLKVLFHDTTGPLFKSLRRYSDTHIGGVYLTQHGDNMLLTVPARATGVNWRTVQIDGIPAVVFDCGPAFLQSRSTRSALVGRERILAGAEKLLNNFDHPIKSEIPFQPTDRQSLKTLLNDEEQKQFLAAEGMLYKGKFTNAEDLFSAFSAAKPEIRPLALYRLGEAQYRLQKYKQALDSFKAAAGLWQDFLSYNPAVMFYYGDSIVRAGDWATGRNLLSRLIIANSDKMFAPLLLVRMGDVLARQGRESEALAIYKTVVESFDKNKAQQVARIRLADRSFLEETPDTYSRLGTIYSEVATTTADIDLREEAIFKRALLEAIHGPAEQGLTQIVGYQKRYPKGVYSTVVRDIREDLVALVYKEGDWGKNPSGLLRLVTDNQDYLATTVKNPDVLPAVTVAFEKVGQPLDMIALYATLLDRPWIGDRNAAYLTFQIADQSELLGDTIMARKALQSFLLRTGDQVQARWAKERLGALQYAAGEFAAVRNNLSWVLAKDQKAELPLSYYYLGRSLWDIKDFRKAALSMELYLAAAKSIKTPSPLVSDAYYVAAMSYSASGDQKSAERLLEAAVKVVPAERRDQFIYRQGELARKEGRQKQANDFFEKIVKEGKDPDWQRLARQALIESKTQSVSSGSSKK